MTIVQSPYFRRSYKKLHASQLTVVVQGQLYLQAYEQARDTLYLLALGVHEKFYRDLKKNK